MSKIRLIESQIVGEDEAIKETFQTRSFASSGGTIRRLVGQISDKGNICRMQTVIHPRSLI